ncbi:AMIN domain-containing protein [Leptolyngbya sp. PCC 7375]|nr:AMIN domain-containing protein [Leptolyngbya sp. PCC 7375]
MAFKHCLHQSLGGSLIALALSMAPAFAENLQNWSFDTGSNELTFSLSDEVFPEFFLLSEPPRLVLDIPNTDIGDIDPEQIYDGAVKNIRVAQYTPENVRVVIELAPEIVLSPEQADIQFDDSDDGQRHWRFRPLIAENNTVAQSTSLAPAPAQNSDDHNVSLAAANLHIPQSSPTTTALPIDPYESEASSGVVSVPPLEEGVVSVPPLEENDGVSVPPLAGVNVPSIEDNNASDNAASVAVVDAEVPELPPMTVPELEDTGTEDVLTPTVFLEVESRQSTLPDLAASTSEQPVAAAESISSEVTQNADVAVAGDETVAAEEPTPAVKMPGESSAAVPDVEMPASARPAETALAPVELSSLSEEDQTVAEDRDPPDFQTIQQPAAERTIVQTDLPVPLQFGQPLPEGI